MPRTKQPEGPLTEARLRLKLANRNAGKAQLEFEHQRRLEQIAEEAAKAEITKARSKPAPTPDRRSAIQNAERAQPARIAPRTLSPDALPIGAPGITGARYHLIEREWHRSETFRPAPRPSYTGYGIKRRP